MMTRFHKGILLLLFLLLPGGMLRAELTAVPTFECMSLYWDVPTGAADRAVSVRYRSRERGDWRAGQDLWFDRKNHQYRGSVVNLVAGREYEFELSLDSGVSETVVASTWSDTFPVGSTIELPAGEIHETIRVTEGGTPGSYRLYIAGKGGTVIDVANSAETCLSIEADYVIVRGVTCRGAQIDGLRIGNHRNVVIEGCEITEWGRSDEAAGKTIRTGGEEIAIPANLARHLDAGIRVKGPDSEQIIIQGNRIHGPRYTANNWTQASPYFSKDNYLSTHPQGANGIVFDPQTKGRHVIRWNEVGNCEGNFNCMFNDALLASEPKGNGFVADGDIYGNRISDCWDDGIEVERGDRNIRVWGNHFSRMIKCVSSGYIWDGPVYVWRNVAEDLLHPNEMPNHNGGRSPFPGHPPCFMPPQQEAPSENRDGVVYVYHNTMLTGKGAGAGWAFNTWPKHSYKSASVRLIARNNIWQTRPYEVYFTPENPNGENFYVRDFFPGYFDQDSDLHSGIITPSESAGAHTIQGEPTFRAGHGAGKAGLYQLAEGTPGHDDGVVIPNFSEGFRGSAPDRGAHEGESEAMVFGVENWTPKSGPPTDGRAEFTMRHQVIADARVDSSLARTNDGSGSAISVQMSKDRVYQSYLRFQIDTSPGKVTAARLLLIESPDGSSASDNGAIEVRSVEGEWNESEVTWKTRPKISEEVLGKVAAGVIGDDDQVVIPLDPRHFIESGEINLALTGTTPGNDTPFLSREAREGKAALELTIQTGSAKGGGLEFISHESGIKILQDGTPLAEYVFKDPKIPRPYFANLHAPDGTRLTRNFPPIEGVDPVDHALLHPGLWLAFGDLNGVDFWRNQGEIEHVKMITAPEVSEGRFSFAVEEKYLTLKGKEICRGRNSFSFVPMESLSGTLLMWEAQLIAGDSPLVFGPQHEMGLGFRITTPLLVDGGSGHILGSHGGKDEAGNWGRIGSWWDYAGPLADNFSGILAVTASKNPRPVWPHSRDYGFLSMNPTGPPAGGDQTPSIPFTVASGKNLTMKFGILLHSTPLSSLPFDPVKAARVIDEELKNWKPQKSK